jgi:hypothetical protein
MLPKPQSLRKRLPVSLVAGVHRNCIYNAMVKSAVIKYDGLELNVIELNVIELNVIDLNGIEYDGLQLNERVPSPFLCTTGYAIPKCNDLIGADCGDFSQSCVFVA